MMTCTSEMSGSASSGIRCRDQIPANTKNKVPVKTRKRLRAHHSIQREIILHSSRGIHGELFARDRLPVLLCHDGDLPGSAAPEIAMAFVLARRLYR